MMRRIPLVRRALPARVFASARPRRVFGPAAESLSFAGPNESNQSKGPEYRFVKSAWLQPVAVFGAARSSTGRRADPSSLRDFMDRQAPLLDRRSSIDRLGRPVRLGQFIRLEELAADRSKLEPLEKRRGTRRQSKRKPLEQLGLAESRALTKQMSGQMCVEALCFGDFHLCQQMKVTRPPGRDPATDNVNRPPEGNPTPMGSTSHG